tara:strand:- start:12076 stop:13677 length:1602 start_codon:yes stop_codon:yes gene_type:complete
MDAEYQQWEPHFRELRDAIQPSKGRFSLGEDRSSSTLNKRIIDGSGRQALRTLKAGLMAGMTSPSRPWFKLGLHDDANKDDPDVKAYLHEVQKRMYTVLRGSNIYQTLETCYGDLGLYGTFCGLIVGDFDSVIHSHSFPTGLHRIAENEKGVVDVVHWDIRMTVGQVVSKFGIDKVSSGVANRYLSNDLHSPVDVCAAVEVRRERDPMSPMATDKPLGAFYWETARKDDLLMVGGHGTNGILAPRWERIEGEAWSVSSPGMDALGDCVQLQAQHRDKAMAVQRAYNPPMQAPAGFKSRYRNVPGGITSISTSDIQKGGMRPVHESRPDVQHLMMDIQETQRRIGEAFYSDLFRMASGQGIDGVKGVTATAIAEMHEEKLIALGPVLESLDHGLLTPIIEATFFYMQEAEILPPAPDILNGQPVKVEFISLLAQAQKAVGLASIERTIGFIGSLAAIRPDALDKLDVDTTIDEFSDQVGPPPGIILTTKQAGEIREARAKQQQQQQLMENAQPMAQAASLISEATERGVDGLGV